MKKNYTTPTVEYCIYADICADGLPDIISMLGDWDDVKQDEKD